MDDSIQYYFADNFDDLEHLQVDLSIIQKINKLDRAQRGEIRNQLFERAKALEETKSSHQVVAWLQTCFKLIDQHSYRFNKVFFSPGYEIKDTIARLLRDAHSTVDLCVFTITDYELAQQINACMLRGVKVRIITDDEKTVAKGSEIFELQRTGIPIKTDRSRYHMHNKFGIIDERVAITGSFNWTYTATKHNQENLLTTSNFDIVNQYQSEFKRLWDEMFYL